MHSDGQPDLYEHDVSDHFDVLQCNGPAVLDHLIYVCDYGCGSVTRSVHVHLLCSDCAYPWLPARQLHSRHLRGLQGQVPILGLGHLLRLRVSGINRWSAPFLPL